MQLFICGSCGDVGEFDDPRAWKLIVRNGRVVAICSVHSGHNSLSHHDRHSGLDPGRWQPAPLTDRRAEQLRKGAQRRGPTYVIDVLAQRWSDIRLRDRLSRRKVTDQWCEAIKETAGALDQEIWDKFSVAYQSPDSHDLRYMLGPDGFPVSTAAWMRLMRQIPAGEPKSERLFG
jgi:hypothetical protein